MTEEVRCFICDEFVAWEDTLPYNDDGSSRVCGNCLKRIMRSLEEEDDWVRRSEES